MVVAVLRFEIQRPRASSGTTPIDERDLSLESQPICIDTAEALGNRYSPVDKMIIWITTHVYPPETEQKLKAILEPFAKRFAA